MKGKAMYWIVENYLPEGLAPTEEYKGHRAAVSVIDGGYIGMPDVAKRLCDEMGIQPQCIDAGHKVCSIGFCEKEQKWYGWSHRAIYGFGIGSEVKKGDCAYAPTDEEDFLEDMVRFWSDEGHESTSGEHVVEDGVAGVRVSWVYSDTIPNKEIRGNVSGCFSIYPSKWGRGEWKAETLDDAKQMAIDFANSVA